MPRYVVLYTFTPDGARSIRDSVKRAGAIRQQNARAGFKISDVFWTQGQYDMVAVVEAPSEEAMMGAMLNIVEAGNVRSSTLRAFDATEMSRILAQTQPLAEEAGAKTPARAGDRSSNGRSSANGRAAGRTASRPKAGARRR
jgi:uncharacterized protein with GYD domain